MQRKTDPGVLVMNSQSSVSCYSLVEQHKESERQLIQKKKKE